MQSRDLPKRLQENVLVIRYVQSLLPCFDYTVFPLLILSKLIRQVLKEIRESGYYISRDVVRNFVLAGEEVDGHQLILSADLL